MSPFRESARRPQCGPKPTPTLANPLASASPDRLIGMSLLGSKLGSNDSFQEIEPVSLMGQERPLDHQTSKEKNCRLPTAPPRAILLPTKNSKNKRRPPKGRPPCRHRTREPPTRASGADVFPADGAKLQRQSKLLAPTFTPSSFNDPAPHFRAGAGAASRPPHRRL